MIIIKQYKQTISAVAAILLLLVSGISARTEEYVSFAQTTKTGTYRYKSGNYNNAIGVEELGRNRLRVGIVANYEYKVDGEWMANTGTASEIVTLRGDTAVLIPEDFPACQITLKFSSNKIVVKQKGTDSDCGFGGRTNAGGTYIKTSDELNHNEMIDEETPLLAKDNSKNSDDRIRFKPGASKTIVIGKILRGKQKTYIIGARAGQTIEIIITDGGVNNDVVFSLIAPNGRNLMGDDESGDGYDSRWKGKLPKTGEYKIKVGTIESENVNFKMSVSIR